jgi:hypothetical protein
MGLSIKQQIRAINNAVYDTQLTMVERKFYKWLSTQNRHRHLFVSSVNWKRGKVTYLKITQR